MYRSLAIVPVLAFGVALPAAAQQLTEQAARKVVEANVQAEHQAINAKNAAAVLALHTDDSIRVTGDLQTLIGREANLKWWEGTVQGWEPDPDKIDVVRVVGNDAIVATGSWSGKWHGDNGVFPNSGGFMDLFLRVGDAWKLSVTINSIKPKQ